MSLKLISREYVYELTSFEDKIKGIIIKIGCVKNYK